MSGIVIWNLTRHLLLSRRLTHVRESIPMSSTRSRNAIAQATHWSSIPKAKRTKERRFKWSKSYVHVTFTGCLDIIRLDVKWSELLQNEGTINWQQTKQIYLKWSVLTKQLLVIPFMGYGDKVYARRKRIKQMSKTVATDPWLINQLLCWMQVDCF